MHIDLLINMTEILSKINDPKDLRKLTKKELVILSDELRQFIIDIVSVNGGHFGASLGVVELTIALHYVFNTLKTFWFGMWVTKHMVTKY